jgi:hypothetical protein
MHALTRESTRIRVRAILGMRYMYDCACTNGCTSSADWLWPPAKLSWMKTHDPGWLHQSRTDGVPDLKTNVVDLLDLLAYFGSDTAVGLDGR